MNILHCFGKNCLNLLLPALAGRGFHLAGRRISFSLMWWLSVLRVVSGRRGRPNGMVDVNRVSGCMSVAGYGYESHHCLMVWVRGSRRGGVFRARGSDGSPRNGWMVRTGVREGLQRKWTAVCRFLTPPLAPLKGGIIRVRWPVPAGHCSGKPDGAASNGYRFMGYRLLRRSSGR
jgi:hypothetical protein